MSEAADRSFESITVGEEASFTAEITPDVVDAFAALSGDYNPLHVDEAYAASTALGSRTPHGMIAGAFFSRLIGMHLPGRRALYLSQTLTFHHPLPLSGSVVVRGKVTHKTDAARTLTLETTVEADSTSLVRGTALVRVLE